MAKVSLAGGGDRTSGQFRGTGFHYKRPQLPLKIEATHHRFHFNLTEVLLPNEFADKFCQAPNEQAYALDHVVDGEVVRPADVGDDILFAIVPPLTTTTKVQVTVNPVQALQQRIRATVDNGGTITADHWAGSAGVEFDLVAVQQTTPWFTDGSNNRGDVTLTAGAETVIFAGIKADEVAFFTAAVNPLTAGLDNGPNEWTYYYLRIKAKNADYKISELASRIKFHAHVVEMNDQQS